MQGCVVVPYLTRHDVSSAQAVGVHSINNCVVLGKHVGGWAVHSAFKSYWGPQQHLQIQIIRDQGRQQCWLEMVVYTHPLWGLITDVCVVAGTGHRHT